MSHQERVCIYCGRKGPATYCGKQRGLQKCVFNTPPDKQTDSSQPALQPCPFCGATPNLKQVPSRTCSANYWWIGCEIVGDNLTHSLTGCGIGHSAWSESDVVAKWNTRAHVRDGVVAIVDYKALAQALWTAFWTDPCSDKWSVSDIERVIREAAATASIAAPVEREGDR